MDVHSFDERVADSERQHNMNPYGQPIQTTGGPDYDERIADSERQHNMNPYGQPIQTTGGPGYDERIADSERQHNMNPYGQPIQTTGSPSYDERMAFDESQVKLAQERDKLILDAFNTLLRNIPFKKEDLVSLLSATEYRLDLMKKLVEHYRDQFLYVVSQYKNDYSLEASELVNCKVTEYLCLIETLKSCGYSFGSEVNSYINSSNFDPYKPDTQLLDIMSIMHVRRKNDANVEIIFPIDYDLTDIDFQQKGDAVTIINNINEHLKNNPNMDVLWSKAGYVALENELNKTI